MIHINLLGEKKDNTALNILQLMIFSIALFSSVATCLFINSSTNSELETIAQEKI